MRQNEPCIPLDDAIPPHYREYEKKPEHGECSGTLGASKETVTYAAVTLFSSTALGTSDIGRVLCAAELSTATVRKF